MTSIKEIPDPIPFHKAAAFILTGYLLVYLILIIKTTQADYNWYITMCLFLYGLIYTYYLISKNKYFALFVPMLILWFVHVIYNFMILFNDNNILLCSSYESNLYSTLFKLFIFEIALSIILGISIESYYYNKRWLNMKDF